jgi:hypothetical protein
MILFENNVIILSFEEEVPLQGQSFHAPEGR